MPICTRRLLIGLVVGALAHSAAATDLFETLPNGVQLSVRSDPSLPDTNLAVIVNAGHLRNPRPGVATAHLFEHIAQLGTAGGGDGDDLDVLMRRFGGERSATTDNYTFTNWVRIQSDGLGPVLDYMAAALHRPDFSDSAIDSQIAAIANERLMGESNARLKDWELGWRLRTQSDDRYFMGGRASFGSIREARSGLAEYHRRFINGSNIVVLIATNVPAEEAAAAATESFAVLPEGARPEAPRLTDIAGTIYRDYAAGTRFEFSVDITPDDHVATEFIGDLATRSFGFTDRTADVTVTLAPHVYGERSRLGFSLPGPAGPTVAGRLLAWVDWLQTRNLDRLAADYARARQRRCQINPSAYGSAFMFERAERVFKTPPSTWWPACETPSIAGPQVDRVLAQMRSENLLAWLPRASLPGEDALALSPYTGRYLYDAGLAEPEDDATFTLPPPNPLLAGEPAAEGPVAAACYTFEQRAPADRTGSLAVVFPALRTEAVDDAAAAAVVWQLVDVRLAAFLDRAREAGFEIESVDAPVLGYVIRGYPEGQHRVAQRMLEALQALDVPAGPMREAVDTLLDEPFAGDGRAFAYSVRDILTRMGRGQGWTDPEYRAALSRVTVRDVQAVLARLKRDRPSVFEIAAAPALGETTTCPPVRLAEPAGGYRVAVDENAHTLLTVYHVPASHRGRVLSRIAAAVYASEYTRRLRTEKQFAYTAVADYLDIPGRSGLVSLLQTPRLDVDAMLAEHNAAVDAARKLLLAMTDEEFDQRLDAARRDLRKSGRVNDQARRLQDLVYGVSRNDTPPGRLTPRDVIAYFDSVTRAPATRVLAVGARVAAPWAPAGDGE